MKQQTQWNQNSNTKQQTQALGDDSDWTQAAIRIGMRLNLGGNWDQDEVVVRLLGLVFQVPIGVFIGFGFASFDRCVC